MFRVLLICIVGGGFIFFGVKEGFQQREEQEWVRTNGEITFAKVSFVPSEEGDTEFRPRIKYKYSVDNIEYIGSTIFRNDSNVFSEDQFLTILDGYTENVLVRMYYDPKDPKSSALFINENNNKPYYLFLIGFVILMMGLFSLFKRIRNRKFKS